MRAMSLLDGIKAGSSSSISVESLKNSCEDALRDDMNTPVLIAHLFDGTKTIRALSEGKESISPGDLDLLKTLYSTTVYEVLGLARAEDPDGDNLTADLVELVLELRKEAKASKDYATADRIREGLTGMGVILKDHKEGTDWEIN